MVLLVWLGPLQSARTIKTINSLQLDLATTAACLGIVTGLVGLHGVLLNNRTMLAWFNLLLWVVLAFSASVGYTSYKMRTYNLRGKLSEAWSRTYSLENKVDLQNDFTCCGFLESVTLHSAQRNYTDDGGQPVQRVNHITEMLYALVVAGLPRTAPAVRAQAAQVDVHRRFLDRRLANRMHRDRAHVQSACI